MTGYFATVGVLIGLFMVKELLVVVATIIVASFTNTENKHCD